MRYKDFATETEKLKESKLTYSPGIQGYGTMTAMSPKTLDMVRNIQQWEREKAAVKVNKTKEKSPNKPGDRFIELGAKQIPLRFITSWVETHNKQQAFDNFSKFGMSSIPLEIRKEINSDVNWQTSVLRILELCEAIVKSRELPPPNVRRGKGSWQLERMGYDAYDGYKAIKDYNNSIQKILDKHNIDKHGRKLPAK